MGWLLYRNRSGAVDRQEIILSYCYGIDHDFLICWIYTFVLGSSRLLGYLTQLFLTLSRLLTYTKARKHGPPGLWPGLFVGVAGLTFLVKWLTP